MEDPAKDDTTVLKITVRQDIQVPRNELLMNICKDISGIPKWMRFDLTCSNVACKMDFAGLYRRVKYLFLGDLELHESIHLAPKSVSFVIRANDSISGISVLEFFGSYVEYRMDWKLLDASLTIPEQDELETLFGSWLLNVGTVFKKIAISLGTISIPSGVSVQYQFYQQVRDISLCLEVDASEVLAPVKTVSV